MAIFAHYFRNLRMQRSYLLILLGFFLIQNLSGQLSEHSHKAKINLSSKNLSDLIALGIAVDHGIHVKGSYFIGDFSHDELERIQSAGFKMEMVLDKYMGETASQRGGTVNCPVKPSNAPYYPLPQNYPFGSMGGFVTLAEMYESIDDMRSQYPKLVTLRRQISNNKTANNNSIYYVKISDNPEIDENEPEILYTALHHAREPLSASQMLYFMWYLLENYDSDPEVKRLVDSRELYFIACLNPDGYEHNRTTNPTGGGFWRKNRRNNNDNTYGVDLNRNYSYAWGFNDDGSSPMGTNDTYRGYAPFSEPETRSLKTFIEARDFNIVLNYHTWGDLLIMPWGYSETICEDSSLYFAMAKEMTKYNHFKAGTSRATLNYSVNGTSDDWNYGEVQSKKKIFAFTPEVGYAFWPDRKDILTLNHTTQYMNFASAWNTGQCAHISEHAALGFDSESRNINIELTRTGVQDGPIEIIATSNFPGIQFNKSVFSFNLNPGETRNVDLDFTFNIYPNVGDSIVFTYEMQTGSYRELIQSTKIYLGQAMWSEDFLTADKWQSTTNKPWSLSTTEYTSAPSSLTDSPNDNTTSNVQKEIQTTQYINLKTAKKAYLSFSAKWDFDSERDYAQVLVSIDDFNYVPLCGAYTSTGGSFQDNGNPLYTGTQSQWIREWIDISEYVGQRIYIKLLMNSNSNLSTHDGIYIDDIKVYSKFYTDVNPIESEVWSIYPQPATNSFSINTSSEAIDLIQNIELVDIHSHKIACAFTKKASQIICQINEKSSSGIYTVIIHNKTGKPVMKKVILQQQD